MAIKRYYVDLTSGSNSRTQDGSANNWANAWLSPTYAFTQFAAGNAGNDIELYIRGVTAYAPASGAGFLDTNGQTATTITVFGEGAWAHVYDTTKGRLEFTDIYAIYPRGYAGVFKLKNLQFKITMSAASSAREWINGSSFAAGFQGICENVRVHLVNNHATNAITGFWGSNSAGKFNFINTLLVHSGSGPMLYGMGCNVSGVTPQVKTFNSLVDGPCVEGYRKVDAYNCIDVRSTLGFNNDQGVRITVNGASLDGSANTLDVGATASAWDAHFTNRAAGDYSLLQTSSLVGAGANVSSLNGGVITDINGQLISVNWPIGPDGFVDTTPPAVTVATPQFDNLTDRAVDARVNVNEAGGALFVVVADPNNTPTATQVTAGQNHLGLPADGKKNQPITSVGLQVVPAISGLTYSHNYKYYAVATDAVGNPSSVFPSDTFQTLAQTQDPFTFAAVNQATLATVVESNAIQVTLNSTVTIAGNNGQFAVSVDGGQNFAAWTQAATNVAAGNVIKVRQTSSNALNTTVTTTLTLGGVNGPFSVKTKRDVTAPIVYPPSPKTFDGTPNLAQNNALLIAHLALAYARDNESRKPPTPAVGQRVFYVDQNHPSARDANNGLSETTPWLTPDKAYSSVQPGDFVYFKGHADPTNIAAIYNRPTKYGIYPLTPGTAANPITFAAYPGHTVIFQGNGSRSGIELLPALNFNHIYGFIFDGFLKATEELAFTTGKNNVTIEKCLFRNCIDAGLRVRYCTDYTFIDVESYGHGESGFSFRFCNNITLLRVSSHHNDDGKNGDDSDADGIHALACGSLLLIDCNTHHNREDGYDLNADAVMVNCSGYTNSYGANGCNAKLWRRVNDNWAPHVYYIINSWFRGAEESCIKVLEGSESHIWNCVVLNAGDEGISYRTPTDASRNGVAHTLTNTILAGNTLQGADLRAGQSLTERNCLYYNNAAGNTAGFTPHTTSIVNQNPLFVDEANLNLTLQAASPARNAGRIISGLTNSHYLEKDYNKRYRPDAGDWDIGIAEYSVLAAPLTVTNNIATLFPNNAPITPGTRTITFNASDDDGNVGAATMELTVVDITAPDITPPVVTPPIALQLSFANGAGGLPQDTTALLVHLTTASATDETAPSQPDVTHNIALLWPNNALIPEGAHTITASARDAAGNIGTAPWTLNIVEMPANPGDYPTQNTAYQTPFTLTDAALIAHGISGTGPLGVLSVGGAQNGTVSRANGVTTFLPATAYSGNAANFTVTLEDTVTALTTSFLVPVTVAAATRLPTITLDFKDLYGVTISSGTVTWWAMAHPGDAAIASGSFDITSLVGQHKIQHALLGSEPVTLLLGNPNNRLVTAWLWEAEVVLEDVI